MLRQTPLAIGETYHVYNRAAHKIPIFLEERDYERILALLYLGNAGRAIDVRDVLKGRTDEGPSFVFSQEVDRSMVDVLGYSLLPNHFHLILRQKSEDGITRFMRKVCTGYSMYFNLKYSHSGTLFQGRFKSSHLDTDPYFKWIFPYVHLNPVALTDPKWQEKGISDLARATEALRRYRYSSFYDYYVGERPERAILAYEEADGLLDKASDLEGLLADYVRGKVLYETFDTDTTDTTDSKDEGRSFVSAS